MNLQQSCTLALSKPTDPGKVPPAVTRQCMDQSKGNALGARTSQTIADPTKRLSGRTNVVVQCRWSINADGQDIHVVTYQGECVRFKQRAVRCNSRVHRTLFRAPQNVEQPAVQKGLAARNGKCPVSQRGCITDSATPDFTWQLVPHTRTRLRVAVATCEIAPTRGMNLNDRGTGGAGRPRKFPNRIHAVDD